jgi:hypothetical protein
MFPVNVICEMTFLFHLTSADLHDQMKIHRSVPSDEVKDVFKLSHMFNY